MEQATLVIRRNVAIGRPPRGRRGRSGDFRIPRFVLRRPWLAVLAFPWLFGAGALAQHYAYPLIETIDSGAAQVFDLHEDNGRPEGIAWAGGTFHVVDASDDKVYAYGPGGQHEPESDFDLDAGNGRPEGVAWAAGRFHVVDRGADRVFAYELDGSRDAAADFDLHADNGSPTGMVWAAGRFYVVDRTDDKAYAYGPGGRREPASDFDLRDGNGNPAGIVWAAGRFHVADATDDKVYAYGPGGRREPASDFDLRDGNGNPAGIVWAAGHFRVVDATADKVYPYAGPEGPEGKVGISGTAQAAGGEDSPLAGAECEFAALDGDGLGPGDRLAAATADDSGVFHMLAPPESDGHLICRPAGLANAGLRAFLRTGQAQSRAAGRAVSPRTTVIALLLTADAARDPGIDMNGRAGELNDSLVGDAHFGLLADAAAGLFGVLLDRNVDAAYVELLIDAFGNGRIDGDLPDAGLVAALHGAIDAAEERAGTRLFAAATRTFADFPLLAQVHGIDEPSPPPPIAPDPSDLASLAHNFRTLEFARNPALHFMNADWAYARGLTGEGETVGMIDTGIYAAHEEFAGQLHGEAVYTVLSDDADGDGWPQFSYHKAGEKDPSTAYPPASPETDASCQGVFCKFYEYSHGSQMASLAAGARNDLGAHGAAFGARLIFRPFRQRGTDIGRIYFHPPPPEPPGLGASRHQVVREVGDQALIVSNSWLSRNSNFWVDYGWPFHEVLTPRYAAHQSARAATAQPLFVWAAGNVPLSGGPWTGEAAVPSLSERQVRAASGGATGLADLLLTDERRASLSDDEALRRAEQAMDTLKRSWLAVAAIVDLQESVARFNEHVACASSSGGGDCGVSWGLTGSARCGFASDWCVAAGPTWGGVWTDIKHPPPPTGRYGLGPVRTSESTALASGALAVLMQSYRDANGELTMGTSTVLKRLKATARRDMFDPAAMQDWYGSDMLSEEAMIRSLIHFSQASDDELRALIRDATQELDAGEAAGAEQQHRLRVLNRLVPYYGVIQTEEIHKMLKDAEGDAPRTNNLLAVLIRQVEWIDEQLLRRGLDKFTVTDADVREIAITSLIGHGLIDLRAATDPAE